MSLLKLVASKVLEICGGRLIQGNLDTIFEKYADNTKDVVAGDIFIGIKGENFNGNHFVNDALEHGAKACIVDEIIDVSLLNKYPDRTIIQVDNTVSAIQKLASYTREQYDIPVIAITGSVGKTSTKDVVASVVSKKYNVLKTKANNNSQIGLPLTLLRLDNHTAAVVEIGMSHLGELSILSKISKPTLAIITNVGTAHIGNLGSRENILKAKLEILDYLKEDGKLLINNDNDLLHDWYLKNKKDFIYTYGIENSSNFNANNIIEKENSSYFEVDGNKILVPVCGKHFVYNSLCAYSVGSLLGIDTKKIIEGIANFDLTPKRMEIVKLSNDISIIEDYYNASYESMSVALNTLAQMPNNRKIAVLGDMLELGAFSEDLHKKVGEVVAKSHVDVLITVGQEAKNIASEAKRLGQGNIYICENNHDATDILNGLIEPNTSILIKASNGMHFGEIANGITVKNNN